MLKVYEYGLYMPYSAGMLLIAANSRAEADKVRLKAHQNNYYADEWQYVGVVRGLYYKGKHRVVRSVEHIT